MVDMRIEPFPPEMCKQVRQASSQCHRRVASLGDNFMRDESLAGDVAEKYKAAVAEFSEHAAMAALLFFVLIANFPLSPWPMRGQREKARPLPAWPMERGRRLPA